MQPANSAYDPFQRDYFYPKDGDETSEQLSQSDSLLYAHSGPLFTDYDVQYELDEPPLPTHSLLESYLEAESKTYGMILPPAYPPQGPSTALYGNPFAYNLHTILEESENESSLQTVSSLTSSTPPHSSFEPYDVSTSNTVHAHHFSIVHHHHLERGMPLERSHDEGDAHSVSSLSQANEEEEELEPDTHQPDNLSSRLERYFTSSLLYSPHSPKHPPTSTCSCRPLRQSTGQVSRRIRLLLGLARVASTVQWRRHLFTLLTNWNHFNQTVRLDVKGFLLAAVSNSANTQPTLRHPLALLRFELGSEQMSEGVWSLLNGMVTLTNPTHWVRNRCLAQKYCIVSCTPVKVKGSESVSTVPVIRITVSQCLPPAHRTVLTINEPAQSPLPRPPRTTVARLAEMANPLNQNFLARVASLSPKLTHSPHLPSALSSPSGRVALPASQPVKFRTICNGQDRLGRKSNAEGSSGGESSRTRYQSLEKVPRRESGKSQSAWENLYSFLSSNPLSKLSRRFKSGRAKSNSAVAGQKSASEPNLSWKRSKSAKSLSTSSSELNDLTSDPASGFLLPTSQLLAMTCPPSKGPEKNGATADTTWHHLQHEASQPSSNRLRRSYSGSGAPSSSHLTSLFKSNSIKQRPSKNSPPHSSQNTPNESQVGELSVSLQMSPNQLQVALLECRLWHLPRHKVDLYVKAYLLCDSPKCAKRKSRVRRATRALSPAGTSLHQVELNEVLEFATRWSQVDGQTLLVGVWSRDTFTGTLLAQSALQLCAQTLHDFRNAKWVTLSHCLSPQSSWVTPVKGTLFVALKLHTEEREDHPDSPDHAQLHVLVKEAQNLNLSPRHLSGNVHCKLVLSPQTRKEDRAKSQMVSSEPNPRWNETVVFPVTAHQLASRQLQIGVWWHSRQTHKPNKTCLGAITLSREHTSGPESALWTQLVERHNMWVYGEIPLRPV